jgi:hypothetical protein
MLFFTMVHCPSCGERVVLALPEEEQCPHCGRYYTPAGYYCACCGGYIPPWLFLPHDKLHLTIGPDALALLCLAVSERFYEGRGPHGKGRGFEALGLLFGSRKGNEYRVSAVLPSVSARVGPGQAGGNWNFGSPGEIARLCGSGLTYLGLFHSHTDGDPRPSERDLPTIGADHCDLIVGVAPAKRRKAWTFSPNTFGPVGAVNGLQFALAAYIRDPGGVVRSLMVDHA